MKGTMRTSGALLAGLLLLAIPVEGFSAPICQKKNKIKIRATECKKKEVQISSLAESPLGIWEHVAGGSLLSDDTSAEPTFLTFGPDGRGRMNLQNPDTGELDCSDFAFSLDSGIQVDSRSLFEGVAIWTSEVDETGQLTLTDARGNRSSFTPVTEVDPAAKCLTLTESQRFEGLPRPTSFTDLVFDGTSLFYTEDDTDEVQRIDPASGAVGSPIVLPGQFEMVQAVQGGDFWTHCRCGNVTDAKRVSQAGVEIDNVNTTNDLGEFLSIRTMAYDDAAGVLTLVGFNFDLGQQRMLRVDSDSEPDALLSAIEFNVFVNGLTFDGLSLWGITNDSVLQIDPTSGQVLQTYVAPAGVSRWHGIAAVGPNLFLLGEIGAEGVIVSVTP